MTTRREVVMVALTALLFTLVILALAVLPAAASTASATLRDPAAIGADELAEITPEPGPSLFGGSAALAVGAAALFGALALTAHSFLRPAAAATVAPSTLVGRSPAEILAFRRESMHRDRRSIGSLAGRASAIAERTLERRGWQARIDLALEQAGIELRAGEVGAAVAGVAIMLALVGLLLGGPLFAIALAGMTVVGVKVYVGNRRDKRRARFSEQLGDLLQQLAASLRAGHGLVQAIEGAAREAESPTREELRRFTTEVRLGREFVASLDAVADRMVNEDFRWVVGAIRIHREVGGDLSQVLDRVGETIRSRARLHRQVRSLSAEGRMSAWVLSLLPVVLGLFFSVINPDHMAALTGSSTGLVMLGVGAGLLAVGGLWLRTLIKLDV